MAAGVAVVDGLNVTARESKHRKLALRTVEFADERDGRLIKISFSNHERGRYYSPRHRHNFQQVRQIVEGKVKYGPIEAATGDCIYFPEGVAYGPTEIVSERSVVVTLQTQGPSWGLFPTREQMDAALAEIGREGEIDRESGRVRWPSGRLQDSFEAILEHITGLPVAYPEPRHYMPIPLRTAAFPWVPMPDVDGGYVKALACFNESGPALQLWRLDAGATLPAGRAAMHQLATVLDGRLSVDGTPAPRGTYLYHRPGADYPALRCDEPAELLVVQLPPRGQTLPLCNG